MVIQLLQEDWGEVVDKAVNIEESCDCQLLLE